MTVTEPNAFLNFLTRQDAASWSHTLSGLEAAIHPVDRLATRIWFRFWPLKLAQALAQAENPEAKAKQLLLNGKYRLADHIDSAHGFLYGHRYWFAVKEAVLAQAAGRPAGQTLGQTIEALAKTVAAKLRVDVSLLLGITAVALMTLQQVGLDAFRKGAGPPVTWPRKSPDQTLKERTRPARGLFRFLYTFDKRFKVTFDESQPAAYFTAILGQDLTMAAKTDTRDYRMIDPRRIEGPIPVECRSGACGSCWVGVLGGAERLSEITEFEQKRLRYFGHALEEDQTHPTIRLACQAKCHGPVSLVIPPWNGVIGPL